MTPPTQLGYAFPCPAKPQLTGDLRRSSPTLDRRRIDRRRAGCLSLASGFIGHSNRHCHYRWAGWSGPGNSGCEPPRRPAWPAPHSGKYFPVSPLGGLGFALTGRFHALRPSRPNALLSKLTCLALPITLSHAAMKARGRTRREVSTTTASSRRSSVLSIITKGVSTWV